MIREILLTYYMKLLLSRYMQLDATTVVELPAPEPKKELLLYIHIPFCEQLCPLLFVHKRRVRRPPCRGIHAVFTAGNRSL